MAVLRAGLVAVCLLVSALVAFLAAYACRAGGRVAQALGQVFCRIMLRLLGIRLDVTGTPPSVGDGILLVSNHVSWIDPLVLLAVTPAVVLAKREVGTWPAIGAMARLHATVFVERHRRRGIPQVNRDLAARLGERHNVLLFPEGTTHDGTRRGRFLTSHLACMAGVLANEPGRDTATVQSVALAYSDRAAAWIGDDTLLPHVWTVLTRPGMTCRVAFGVAQPVNRGYDRKVLGRRLAAEVEQLLPADRPLPGLVEAQSPEETAGLIVTPA